jgi:hypothetical protein
MLHKRKKGRPKTLDGKIKMKQPDKRRTKLCYQDDKNKIHEAIVYSISLKCKVKLAYLEVWKNDKYTGACAVLFSTDLSLSGQQIYLYYKSRYQIEFLFRDAKQFTGLTHCQTRSEDKLTFHFNTALTAVSIAKAAYYLKDRVAQDESFSMSDIKTVHLNKIMADRIFNNLEIDLSCRKNRRVYLQALWLGKIAS